MFAGRFQIKQTINIDTLVTDLSPVRHFYALFGTLLSANMLGRSTGTKSITDGSWLSG